MVPHLRCVESTGRRTGHPRTFTRRRHPLASFRHANTERTGRASGLARESSASEREASGRATRAPPGAGDAPHERIIRLRGRAARFFPITSLQCASGARKLIVCLSPAYFACTAHGAQFFPLYHERTQKRGALFEFRGTRARIRLSGFFFLSSSAL